MKHIYLGFTYLFEAFMKKLEVKCKHIEGYCKLTPDRVKYLSYNRDTNSSFNESNFRNSSKEKENNAHTNTLKKTSIIFTRYNDSSIINNKIKYFGLSGMLFFFIGEWHLIDETLGSYWFDEIKVKNNNENSDEDDEMQNPFKVDKDYYDKFNPYYFLAPPQCLINFNQKKI